LTNLRLTNGYDAYFRRTMAAAVNSSGPVLLATNSFA
jgi:hypothetical protein